MSHYIFKYPRKAGDTYLEKVEMMNEFLIQQKALKYGQIEVISEEEYQKEQQQNEKNRA